MTPVFADHDSQFISDKHVRGCVPGEALEERHLPQRRGLLLRRPEQSCQQPRHSSRHCHAAPLPHIHLQVDCKSAIVDNICKSNSIH